MAGPLDIYRAAKRERERTVRPYLGDVIGDPCGWKPTEPLKELDRDWTRWCLELLGIIAFYAGLIAAAILVGLSVFALWTRIVVVNLGLQAFARDGGQYAQASPEIRSWFNSLASGKGNCCSMSDGRTITDADTDIRGNHFWVRVDNEWIEVPDEALVAAPNRIGPPVVWPMPGPDGKTAIRCFLPGAGA